MEPYLTEIEFNGTVYKIAAPVSGGGQEGGQGGQSGGAAAVEGAVSYDEEQALTGGQRATARENIGAAAQDGIAAASSDDTFTSAHPAGFYFWFGGTLYKTTASVAQGDEISPGTNCEEAQLGESVAALEAQVADLRYTPIQIDTFTVTPSTAEMGATVTNVTLAYVLNREAAAAALDNVDVELEGASGSIQKTGLSVTGNQTWTLEATDERGAESAKTATLSFLNTVYYGVAAAPAAIDSAFLLGLAGKALSGSRGRTFTVNAGSGQHIWYAVPARLGACSFNVGGFDGGFTKVSTFIHTNASGYAESYDVYRSDNAALGAATVKAS